MNGEVKLTVLLGKHQEGEHVFDEPAVCTVGRAPDCDIALPANLLHADVSRHHCVFEIDPPTIRVRDLGSFNGTYVNGERIGRRPPDQLPEEVDPSMFEDRELREGDVVQVGSTCIHVKVAVPHDAPGRLVHAH